MLSLCLLLVQFAHAAPAESIRIDRMVKDRAEERILLNENTLEYNATTKQLPDVIADKYRSEILREFPITGRDGETCPPGDRWLVQIGKSSRDFCNDQKAIAFLKKMNTKVKVIIR